MTLFSKLISDKKNRDFVQSEELSKILTSTQIINNKSVALTAGWVIHYATGAAFTLVYDKLWHNTKYDPTIKNGVVMGLASGLFGALVWRTAYHLQLFPSKADRKRYYYHLILAHIVFGLTTTVSYKLIDENETPE